jgi:hypothetical protein
MEIIVFKKPENVELVWKHFTHIVFQFFFDLLMKKFAMERTSNYNQLKNKTFSIRQSSDTPLQT